MAGPMTRARTGAGRVRTSRQERGRFDILEAAAGLLALHGYHGMSMRDLARTTGMSLGNLYNYFRSKEDLLFALQTRAFETLIASAEEAIQDGGDGPARLHAFILSHVRYVATHRDVMRVLDEEAGELAPARRHAIRELKDRYYQIGRTVVAAAAGGRGPAASGVELERATYGIFGMVNWVYGWYDPARHGGPHEVARSLHRIAMNGLGAPAPSRSEQNATERRFARVQLRSPILLHRDDLP